jgi:short-subunit dehydrogenase involved in D-alanine esterification of teichoic acids
MSTYPDLDCVFMNSGIQRGLDLPKPESVDLSLVETELKTNYLGYEMAAPAFETLESTR